MDLTHALSHLDKTVTTSSATSQLVTALTGFSATQNNQLFCGDRSVWIPEADSMHDSQS